MKLTRHEIVQGLRRQGVQWEGYKKAKQAVMEAEKYNVDEPTHINFNMVAFANNLLVAHGKMLGGI